jgi:aldose 1-epimerase
LNIKTISAFGYQATIDPEDASLTSLRFRGLQIIKEFTPELGRKFYAGQVLAPWPNRIRDGRYSIDNILYKIPVNEHERNTALHGFLNAESWSLLKFSEQEISFKTITNEKEYYPFCLEIIVLYQLFQSGLKVTVTAKNLSFRPAPYGVGFHPYVILEIERELHDWFLQIPADNYMKVDEERYLPTQMGECRKDNFDFTNLKQVGNMKINHAFKFTNSNVENTIFLVNAKGEGIYLRCDKSIPWVEIYIPGNDHMSENQNFVAIEPMSCPPDSFNNGIDLIWLHDTAVHTFSFMIGIRNCEA